MSEREKTPEVIIKYGCYRDNFGFYPILKIQQRRPSQLGGPLSQDEAIEMARREAHEEAAKYRGEWTITVERL